MSRNVQRHPAWSLSIVLAAALSTCATTLGAAETATQPAAQALARKIFDATGLKGGLIVHLGCADGKLTAALRPSDAYLVHGLDTAAENVQEARRHIRSLGLDGKVSVDRLAGNRLPYIDNLVNLIVTQQPVDVSREEVLRVLAPGGVAYVENKGGWMKTVKPRPAEIDQWTHFLHGADNNAVSRDEVVGPPRHVQWKAEPLWTRNHHTLASISAVVSTEDRVFYIVDEAPAGSMEIPGRWSVVARDAFNGKLLWNRPIPTWAWHQRKFRSGPVQLPRTLVAVDDRVYVPLGLSAPLTALDAATGRLIRTYKETDGTEEVVLHQRVLLVVTGSPSAEHAAGGPQRSPAAKFPNQKSIVALRAQTGDLLWKWTEPETSDLVPLTLAADQRRVFFASGKTAVCLDLASGKELWRQKTAAAASGRGAGNRPKPPQKRKPNPQRSAGWSVDTLVVRDGVVLWASGGRLVALAADSGNALWECPCKAGFRSPADVFVAGGLVWLGPGFTEGRDLHSGEVKKTSTAVQDVWTAGHHHRCYREKATERYILTGYRGIEFLDLAGDDHTRNNWVRGVCQIGIMPSNGLIYAPSHTCGCFMEAKLIGFWALAPQRKTDTGEGSAEAAARLQRGPAFGQADANPSSAAVDPSDQWPTLRQNPLRSGSTETQLPARLQDLWRASVGGRLSAPVVAGGKVLVASVEEHRVVALSAENGDTEWAFTAGGRVDSPPTVHAGLALFGSADGWVYCLRLADGRLVWRFRAAREDLRTVALDQVESVWPVHGSVLVQHGVAYVAAGRSSYLDDGIQLYGLDPATGKILCQSQVSSEHPTVDKTPVDKDAAWAKKIGQNATDYKTFTHPDRSDGFSMEGATNDVLVGDGHSIYMRHVRFDRNCTRQEKLSRHLFSTSSLLDDSEVHRTHWVLGTGDFSRVPVAYSWIVYNPPRFGSSLLVPHGMMLAFDEETVWGVRRPKAGGYELFAQANGPFSADEPSLPDFRNPKAEPLPQSRWLVELPMRPRAMLRAGKSLVLGGMPLGADPADLLATYEGRTGGLLWTASTADGSPAAQYKLPAPPVWDGMATAAGRLYVVSSDGRVVCMGEGK